MFLQTIAETQTVVLSATPSGGTPTYTWSPAADLNDASVANPVFTPPGTDSFTFTLEADFGAGCVATGQVVINVVPGTCIETINAGPDQTIVETQTATLSTAPSGGTPTYTWSPATDLSSASSPDPVFTPSGPGTFTFTVQADYGSGCVFTDQVTVQVNRSCAWVITTPSTTNPC